jgi:uncharacterized protein YuzE
MKDKMKITYDKNVDALYIELKAGAYDRTKKVTGDIFVDINKRGRILGIEILDASKNIGLVNQKESQILWETLPSKPQSVSSVLA